MALFVVSSGDGWSDILRGVQLELALDHFCIPHPSFDDFSDNNFQTIGCGKVLEGYMYFYSYYLIVTLVFLNLFIAIILDGFQET